MTAANDDPLASGGGQFPLCAPTGTVAADDEPCPVGLRPWGLRTLTVAAGGRGTAVPARYDHERQVAVDRSGTPLIELPSAGKKGDPSADTTSTVDGEDPPSSEDWKNDFCPDEPFQP